ncbi:hypothetical protein L249_6620, partial [Ophiocordyceps polyrhachis-furcata BCC 54312]
MANKEEVVYPYSSSRCLSYLEKGIRALMAASAGRRAAFQLTAYMRCLPYLELQAAGYSCRKHTAQGPETRFLLHRYLVVADARLIFLCAMAKARKRRYMPRLQVSECTFALAPPPLAGFG